MTIDPNAALLSSAVVHVHDMSITYILLIIFVIISMIGGYILAVKFMDRNDRKKVSSGGSDDDPCKED